MSKSVFATQSHTFCSFLRIIPILLPNSFRRPQNSFSVAKNPPSYFKRDHLSKIKMLQFPEICADYSPLVFSQPFSTFLCLVPGPIRLSFLCSLAYSWVLTREDRGQDIYSLTPNSFSSAISSIFYVRVSFLYFLLYFWPQSLFQYKQEFLLTVKVHNHQIQTPKMSTARILVMTKLAERLPSK